MGQRRGGLFIKGRHASSTRSHAAWRESSISYREWRQKSRAFCVRVRVISARHVLIKGRGSIYRLAPREAKKGTTSSGKDR